MTTRWSPDARRIASAFPPGPTFDHTVTAVFFLTVMAAACLMPLQNDTWWHLRAGEEMWARGMVMLQDEFSFTARGAYWPNHEWVSEVLFHVLYRAGGLPLLTFVAAACLTAAIAVSWSLMAGSALARLMLMGVGIPSLAFAWTVRPHVFTQLLLMLAVHLCLRRAFWALPPVFAIWANLHGGVALGFVVLGAALLSDAYLVGGRRALRLVPVLVTCFAATMISPLGFDLWPTIPESVHKSVSNGIAEWRPPVVGWRDLGFWLVAIAFGVGVIRAGGAARPLTYRDALLAILALLLLPLALRHSRNMTPFVLVALPVISRTFDLPGIFGRVAHRQHRRVNAALAGTCAVVAAGAVAHAWTGPASRLAWDPVSPPVVDGIRQCPGRLYNRFDDGGYVIWFARVPVFVDSRQDPYPLEFLQEHLRHETSGHYEPVFAKHDLQCAFLPSGSPTAHRLRSDGWQVAAFDPRWVVLYPVTVPRATP